MTCFGDSAASARAAAAGANRASAASGTIRRRNSMDPSCAGEGTAAARPRGASDGERTLYTQLPPSDNRKLSQPTAARALLRHPPIARGTARPATEAIMAARTNSKKSTKKEKTGQAVGA